MSGKMVGAVGAGLGLALLMIVAGVWAPSFAPFLTVLGLFAAICVLAFAVIRVHRSVGQVKERQQRERRDLRGLAGQVAGLSQELSRLRPAISRAGLSGFTAAFDESGERRGPSVLYVSSNGAGLGHLTRLMAVARRVPAEAHFFTMSSAYAKLGLPDDKVTYFPSADTLDMPPPTWNRMFTKRFARFLSQLKPDVVVFDGTYVYDGVTEVCFGTGTRLVWLQRGMWKEEVDRGSHQRHRAARICDTVIVPGDVAGPEEVDAGPNITVHHVPPVTLTNRSEMLSRAAAKEALGLAQHQHHVLVQLGAGVINNVEGMRRRAVDAVHGLGDDWKAVVLRNPLSPDAEADDAISLQAYPIAQYYTAFEFVVVAGGYNSVQEIVTLRVPGIIVPNAHTRTDDQVARANGVAEQGWAVTASDPDELHQAIERLAQEDVQRDLRRRLESSPTADGADAIADILVHEIELAQIVDGEHRCRSDEAESRMDAVTRDSAPFEEKENA